MKPIVTYALLILAAVLLYLWLSPGPKAPLRDGLFFRYDISGSSMTVTFTQLKDDRFEVVLSPSGIRQVVDSSLKDDMGAIFEAGVMGPFWLPPGKVVAGGSAYGDTVDELRAWNGWEVGVVRSVFGVGGALRGEWYYEQRTGFLVGGVMATAVSGEGGGTRFVLIDTNLQDLVK